MSLSRLLDALQVLERFVYVGLGIASFIHWRRRPEPAGAWLAAAFGLLALVVVAGEFIPEGSDDLVAEWGRKASIAILALFPYCLYRFMTSLIRPIRWIWVTAHVATATVALGALALPEFPQSGEPRPIWFHIYLTAFLLQWVFLSGRVAVRLWRAGRGLPDVARRRMRTMSAGAAGLALALVVAGESSGDEIASVAVQILALAAAPLMLIAFAPPFALRAMWRRREEKDLNDAVVSLMRATTDRHVMETLVSQARRLVGGSAAMLEDGEETVVVSDGRDNNDHLTGAIDDLTGAANRNETRLTFPMSSGRLTVVGSSLTPFFGRDEMARLEQLAALADFALNRNRLLDSQRRLAAVVESSEDAILTKSLDGTIESWNRGAEKVYGYSSEEVIGKKISILVPSDGENDVPQILAKIRRGESVEHYETRRQAKDGRILDVALTVSPVRDAEGNVAGASTIARDVTDRKRQAQLLSTIFETSPDIIAMITSSLELVYVNQAAEELLGYGFDELFRHDSLHWVHPDDLQVAAELLQAAFGAGEPAQG
ncbi:MAG: PAS domain S-box protein, partial [Actinomycetota bacterium]|nr:PAS domain S-box protein [Actinomycetota bacterium]